MDDSMGFFSAVSRTIEVKKSDDQKLMLDPIFDRIVSGLKQRFSGESIAVLRALSYLEFDGLGIPQSKTHSSSLSNAGADSRIFVRAGSDATKSAHQTYSRGLLMGKIQFQGTENKLRLRKWCKFTEKFEFCSGRKNQDFKNPLRHWLTVSKTLPYSLTSSALATLAQSSLFMRLIDHNAKMCTNLVGTFL